MSLAKLRKSTSTKEPAKKKSSVRSFEASHAMRQAIKEFRAAKAKEKEAKALLTDAESRMIDESQSIRIRESRAAKENLVSINLTSGKEEIRFTQKRQFAKMDGSHSDAVRAVVGAENFDKWFREQTVYHLDESLLQSLPNADEVAEKLLEALGDHVDILKSETLLVPTTAFADDMTLNESAAVMASELQSKGLAIPYKGSFQ